MKKNKLQDQFLEELAKVPIVQVACEKCGLSRNSVYRWRKEDKVFENNMDEALVNGVAFVNDMSESQLLTLIKEKSYSAISFWLRHRNDNYKDKIEVTGNIAHSTRELTAEDEELIKESLRLALPNNQDHNDIPKTE